MLKTAKEPQTNINTNHCTPPTLPQLETSPVEVRAPRTFQIVADSSIGDPFQEMLNQASQVNYI
jgi:hypothetical protein